MLDKVVRGTITNSLDWFFETVLKDHYDKRRQLLTEPNKIIIPVIDYVLQTYASFSDAVYPPNSASEWIETYKGLNSKKDGDCFQKLLLIYLKLDISSYISPRKEGSTVRASKDKTHLTLAKVQSLDEVLTKLQSLPHAFDFPNSVIHLSTGLWAIDNEETSLAVSSLSNPSVKLTNYFENAKEVGDIIINSLIISHQPRIALFMSKIHRHENWDENFDPVYAFLMINADQLSEALRYERIFSERDNYPETLQRFFKLCSDWNVTKSLNLLNLSNEEEDMLNQHIASVESSRPVTPASGKQNHSSSVSSKQKPRNKNIQMVQRTPSFNDSPARNTRSARKRKPVK